MFLFVIHPPVPLSEMRSRVFALEEELSDKSGKLISIQSELAQSKKELAAKEVSLQKARDELSLAHTRMAQDSQRVKAHNTISLPLLLVMLLILDISLKLSHLYNGCWPHHDSCFH